MTKSKNNGTSYMTSEERTIEGQKLGAITDILERGLTEKTLRYWEAGLPADYLVELAVEEAGEPEQCLEDKVQVYAEKVLNILCSEKVKEQAEAFRSIKKH